MRTSRLWNFLTSLLTIRAFSTHSTKSTSINIFASSAMSTSTISIESRVKGTLIGFYAGDSLAMPVHWYYDINQLKNDFGTITKYEEPKSRFPGSIMNLSNTGGGGRGSDKGSIIGDVILHGKKEFWGRGKGFHYHHGMKAGENTLDALITRLLIQNMNKNKNLDIDDFINEYIKFMTTPGNHNDTYAGTWHRMFFKNWIEGIEPSQCPDNDGHNVDSIDSLMLIPPIIIAYKNKSKEERNHAIKSIIQSTRRISDLSYHYAFGELLYNVLNGQTMQEASIICANTLRINLISMVRSHQHDDPMTACYLDSAVPAMLIFAYKYGNDPETLLLKSTNAGGENVARTSLLGALAGAQYGIEGLPERFRNDLLKSEEYEIDSQEFIDNFVTKS